MKKWLSLMLLLCMLLSASSAGAELTGTLSFLSGETDEEQVLVHKAIIAEFEALHPGVKIDFQLTGFEDRDKKILADLYAGAPVDVIQVDAGSAGLYAQAGILLELDDLMAEIGLEDFKKGSRLMYNGHDYAIPYAGANQMMYVRTDLLEEAGLGIPTTWDELLAAAEALTKGDTYGVVLPAGQNAATTFNLSNFVYQAGGCFFDENHNPQLDSQPVIDALTFYGNLAKYAPSGISSYGYGDLITAFCSGKVGIAFYQGRIIARLANEAPHLEDKYALVSMPLANPDLNVHAGGYVFYAVGANCENPELAKEFLKFLTTGDRALRVAMSAPGHLPAPLYSVDKLIEGYEDDFVRAHLDKILFAHEDLVNGFTETYNAGGIKDGVVTYNGKTSPYYNYMNQYNVVSKMVQRVVIENMDPAESARMAQEEMLQIIKDNPL